MPAAAEGILCSLGQRLDLFLEEVLHAEDLVGADGEGPALYVQDENSPILSGRVLARYDVPYAGHPDTYYNASIGVDQTLDQAAGLVRNLARASIWQCESEDFRLDSKPFRPDAKDEMPDLLSRGSCLEFDCELLGPDFSLAFGNWEVEIFPVGAHGEVRLLARRRQCSAACILPWRSSSNAMC